MAGFTPSIASAVWMGTDMNSPIRTARGTPIEGATLPGEVWHQFMAEALDDEPAEPFAPFRPIGEAPSSAEPGAETSTPTTSEAGATPTPTGVAPSGTAPVPPDQEDEPTPGEGLLGGPEPTPEPDPHAASPDTTSPPPRAGLFRQREPAEPSTAPDCSASACDESSP
jgi:peptidoglycan glycosyltransferase